VSHVTGCCLVPNKESSASRRKHKLRLNGYITPNFAANNRATLKESPPLSWCPRVSPLYLPCQHRTLCTASANAAYYVSQHQLNHHANPGTSLRKRSSVFSLTYAHFTYTRSQYIYNTTQRRSARQEVNASPEAGCWQRSPSGHNWQNSCECQTCCCCWRKSWTHRRAGLLVSPATETETAHQRWVQGHLSASPVAWLLRPNRTGPRC
jgi:hypothetical protein